MKRVCIGEVAEPLSGEASGPLLRTVGLRVEFPVQEGSVKAIDSVTLDFSHRSSTALIGESGSGKSVFALSLVNLLPKEAIVSGEIWFKGKDLRKLRGKELQLVRGREIALILQNPDATFNPVLRIGYQAAESVLVHDGGQKRLSMRRIWRERALSLLGQASVPQPTAAVDWYPHQYSGGMKERVAIVSGCQLGPALLIADEPTKGLDNEMREKALAILRDSTRKTALLLITHDIRAALELCEMIGVFYAGELVEMSPVSSFLSSAAHPYTLALLDALPSGRMMPIPGNIPSLIHQPRGCRFSPRCSTRYSRCEREHPGLSTAPHGGSVRCHLYD
jgi:peptide/nickel transport system ATP-binding protein